MALTDDIEVKLLWLSALVDQRLAMRRDMTDEEWDAWHFERGWVKDEDGLWVHRAAMAYVKEKYGLGDE